MTGTALASTTDTPAAAATGATGATDTGDTAGEAAGTAATVGMGAASSVIGAIAGWLVLPNAGVIGRTSADIAPGVAPRADGGMDIAAWFAWLGGLVTVWFAPTIGSGTDITAWFAPTAGSGTDVAGWFV